VHRRRDNTLLLFAVVIVVWCAVAAAIVAGGVALLTSVSYLPAYLVSFGVLLIWGVFRWSRILRKYRHDHRQQFRPGRSGDEGDWPGGGGVREPLPSGDPRSPLSAAADPEQSTGPSAIP
jgi:uncharacterized membrane protein YgcG